MKKIHLTGLLAFIFLLGVNAQVTVGGLLCENRNNPLGIDVARPRLSWQLRAERRNVIQSAYEIRVSASRKDLLSGRNLLWNSGKLNSSACVQVPYMGPEIQAAKFYYWEVRIWDEQGNPSAWSVPASWQTGLLNISHWKASWMEAGLVEDSINRPSPLFRTCFSTPKKIASASLFITAHGLYEAFINGKKTGDALLTPGFTSYNKRLQYQAYDVTPLIQSGKNSLAVVLGSGWYRTPLAWEGNKDIYGKTIGLLAQLEIQYIDGTSATIVSDGNWKSSIGSIRRSEIYDGEIQDNRNAQRGWMLSNYDDHDWAPVAIKNYPLNNLVATENELVTKHEIFKPLRIFKTPAGEQVIDFGQNLVGWVQMNVQGKSGDSVRIFHAEVLDKKGNFYTDNLRAARQENIYILRGEGVEQFEPHFTFQGFRYIKIEGFPGEIKPENFSAVALYSDMPANGMFTSSNAMLNQLQHNIQWGQKGNFLDIPTDCPQRDERLGWTGDAQAFSRTAAFNRGVNNFFAKWLKDLAADQLADGGVPFVVPNVLGPHAVSSTGWADASTIIPWNMYLAYGDSSLLRQQYPSMKAWVNYMRDHSLNDLWNQGFHFGDWLFYRPDDDNDGRSAITDKYLIAQCFYAHSTQLLINTSTVLGLTADNIYYSDLLKKTKSAFLKEYLTPNGRLVSGTQTAYVLALEFDMLPESLRAQAAERLEENIHTYNDHLTTGFIGTPYLCHVLSRFGYSDLAYTLLLQDTYPSWLYPVKMGATTIWERWDGQKPDSSFETPSMNSFNHYAYGAIGDFMYRDLAGLDTDPEFPGYKKMLIKPIPGGHFSFVAASLNTYYGLTSSRWQINGNQFVLDVQIPPNTSAQIVLPTADKASVMEGGKPLSVNNMPDKLAAEQLGTVVEVGSGVYHFTCDLK